MGVLDSFPFPLPLVVTGAGATTATFFGDDFFGDDLPLETIEVVLFMVEYTKYTTNNTKTAAIPYTTVGLMFSGNLPKATFPILIILGTTFLTTGAMMICRCSEEDKEENNQDKRVVNSRQKRTPPNGFIVVVVDVWIEIESEKIKPPFHHKNHDESSCSSSYSNDLVFIVM